MHYYVHLLDFDTNYMYLTNRSASCHVISCHVNDGITHFVSPSVHNLFNCGRENDPIYIGLLLKCAPKVVLLSVTVRALRFQKIVFIRLF